MPTERAITVDRLAQQIMEWTMASEDRPYFITFYLDAGQIYGLFNQRGALLRAPLDIDSTDNLYVGPLVPVSEQFSPIARSCFRVYRQADGRLRFAMVAGTAILNRVGEIDSTALYDDMIARAEQTGFYPRLDFYHLGDVNTFFEFGQFDFLMRRGVCYIGSGLLDEGHPLAEHLFRAVAKNGEYWGASVEYYPELMSGLEYQKFGKLEVLVATRGLNTRISVLPETDAACWFTSVAMRRDMSKKIDDRKLAAFRTLFGENSEQFDAIVAETDDINEMVERMQLVFRDAVAGKTATAAVVEDVTDDVVDAELTGDIELDDEAVEVITRAAVAQFDDRLTPLADALTNIGKMVERMAGQLGGMTERLAALEADDETKRREWVHDLPAKSTGRKLTFRPRQERNEGAEELTTDDIANKTLAKFPKVAFVKS